MIITTTVDDVLFSVHNDGFKVRLVNPDILSILEQIKSATPADPVIAKLIAAKSKKESVEEIATANLEAAIAVRTLPIGQTIDQALATLKP